MIKKLVVAAALLLGMVGAAFAQFVDQQTYAGAGAGSANAQTATLANVSSLADVLGVKVIFVPGATNTASMTLNLSGAGAQTVKKPNGAGLTNLVGGEIVSGQPTMVMWDGTEFVLMTPAALPVGAAYIQNSGFGFGAPANLQINGTVNSNQLTIALKGINGSDPSAANPIPVAFRDSTIANGDPVWVSVTSALSFTIGSGSTMGCQSATMCRLWVFAANDAGTVRLCAYNARSGTASIIAPDEAALQTSAAGSSGGSSAQTFYCNSAITSKAIRYIGYVDIQETVAGTWAAGPTYTQLFGPGIKKPGEIVQTLYSTTTTDTTGSGTAGVYTATTSAQSVTPHSAADIFRVVANGNLTQNAPASPVGYAIFRASGASPACTTMVGGLIGVNSTAGGAETSASIVRFDEPNTTGQITYALCITLTNSTTPPDWCPANALGAATCAFAVDEIMGALEPANDDNAVLAAVG